MVITNLLAFTAYFPDPTIADMILYSRGIVPALQDQIEVSSAWGMLEKAKGSDYSQGRTSEKLSSSARLLLRKDAIAILQKHGIVHNRHLTANIMGYQW